MKTSSPAPPSDTSSPAPASARILISAGDSPVLSMVSAPAKPLISSRSPGPPFPVIRIVAASPVTLTTPEASDAVILSSAAVAPTTTTSCAPPGTPKSKRLASTSVTPVPDRSLTLTVSAPPNERTQSVSKSAASTRSVALPASRLMRTRSPTAASLKSSLAEQPLSRTLSVPPAALEHVAAVAGFRGDGVVAGAEEHDVVAALAVDEVVAVPADQHVVAVGPEERVVAAAALLDELERQRHGAGLDPVVTGQRVDGQVVAERVGVPDRDEGREPEDERRAGAEDVGEVVAARAVQDEAIRAVVGRSAAGHGRQILDHLLHAGPGHVVDRQGIVSTERGHAYLLERGEAHADRSDVTREAGARAVGREANLLVRVAAVEGQRVEALAAVDLVAAVGRVPDEPIVAGAERRDVIAAVAVNDVLAGCADQLVGAPSPQELIGAVLPVDARRSRGGQLDPGVVDAHAVVAGAREDADAVEPSAGDPEVGRPVVADVDLERRRGRSRARAGRAGRRPRRRSRSAPGPGSWV